MLQCVFTSTWTMGGEEGAGGEESSETQTVRCVWSLVDVTSLAVRVAMAACRWSD